MKIRSRKDATACLIITAAACLSAAAPAAAVDSTELEPIVVTQSAGQGTPNLASAVLTQEDIRRLVISSPEAALSALGADLQTRGRSSVKSDLALNASTFQQVLVLVNGVRVKDSQTSHHDLDLFFSIEDIERVELIPAAAAVKYGPDGIGGAVNFVLKKPASAIVAEEKNGEKNMLSLAGGNDETFEASGRLLFPALAGSHSFSASHASSAGSRYDTDFRNETFFYSGGWQDVDNNSGNGNGNSKSLSLDAGYNEKEFGAYDFYTPNSGFPSKEWTNTRFVNASALLSNDPWTIEPRVNFREHHDKFALNVEDLSAYLNHHCTDTYQTGATVTRRFDNWSLPLGFDYGEEHITSTRLGDHNRGHWDVFLDPRFELSDATALNVTLRHDDYTTFGNEATASASVTHRYSDLADVFLAFGRTMRVPTFTELYYSDPTTAGDPDLKPEHSLNLDAGWHKKVTPDTDVTLSAFARREDDTIDFTKRTPADARFVARNISDALAWGLNGFVAWQASDSVSLDLRYVYSDKDLDESGQIYKYGLGYMKHMVCLGFDWDLAFGHNRIDIEMKKKPVRRAWVVVNDRFTLPIKHGWQAFFEAYNLFNQEYQEIEGIPEQGRLFKLGLALRW